MVAVKTGLPRRKFDVVIVGAGGAGMRASLQLEAGLNVAVLSKVSRPARTPWRRRAASALRWAT
jgi:glycine/D-amino acid oxidase-like deaminating enzyme